MLVGISAVKELVELLKIEEVSTLVGISDVKKLSLLDNTSEVVSFPSVLDSNGVDVTNLVLVEMSEVITF
jgi:hypothetical protein